MSTEEKINFPFATSLDWSKMATQELNDSDPLVKLSKSVAGISVKPYYDVNNVPQVKNSVVKSGLSSWLNVPKISVEDAKHANSVALDHLSNGADGILFGLKANAPTEQLLNGIQIEHCHVFFTIDNSAFEFRDAFKTYVESKKVDPNGGFYFEGESIFHPIRNFRSNGIIVQSKENCVEQILWALNVACSRMDQLTNAGDTAEQALQSISFLWPMRMDFFVSVSELRAMRMCWNLFCKAYHVESSPLFLHSYSSAWSKENFQPHANMIAQTSAGLSAVLGCADAFTSVPENENVNLLARSSRNISSILKEESHLDKVIDPLAGAYFMEETSVALARGAWKKFQETV